MAEPVALPPGFRIVTSTQDDNEIYPPPVPARGGGNGGGGTGQTGNNGTAYTRFIESNPVTQGLVGIGAGLTKAATGAIQAGAQLVGADGVANAAGRVTQGINRDVDRLGTAGAVGEFVGEVAPYVALPVGGATLAGRTALGAAGGALAGGLQAQETPDLEARRNAYLQGGAIGAVAPAALQGAGKVIGATARGAATGARVTRNAVTGRSADQIFNDVVSRSTKTPQQIRDELASGTISNIADVAGDEVRGLTRAVGKTEGGRNIVSEALEGRSLDAVRRVSNDLSKNVSNVDTYFGNLDDLAKARAKVSEPLYKDAYQKGASINDPRLNKFLNDKRISDAIVDAKKDYGVRLEAPSNSLEALDGAKKVLDDRIGVAVRAGENEKVRALTQFKNQFVSLLDENVPEYAKTRKVFSGFSLLKQAQEDGLKFTNQTSEQLRRTLKDMTPDQREAFRIGVRESLQRTVNQTSDGADPAKRIFGNTQRREQLEAVFGNGKHFQDFAKRMQEEIRAADTKFKILGGSRTDVNLEGDNQFGQLVNQVASQGFKGTFLSRGIEAIGDSISKRYYGLTKQNAEEIARVLVDRNAGIEALDRIIGKQSGNQSNIVREAVEGLRSFKIQNTNPAIPASTQQPQQMRNSQSGMVDTSNAPVAMMGMGAIATGGAAASNGLQLPEGFRIVDSGNGGNNGPKLPPPPPPIAVDVLQREEGYSPKVYRDTVGKSTIGYGFNMQQANARQLWQRAGVKEDFDSVLNGRSDISQESADKLFNETHPAAERAAKNIVGSYEKLGENQQAALTSLAFQLGGKGLREFKRTLKNLEEGNSKAVENSLLQSLYARQTPARAKRTALMLAYDLSPEAAEDMLLKSGRITDRELKFIGRA
jgi:lysozyme